MDAERNHGVKSMKLFEILELNLSQDNGRGWKGFGISQTVEICL
jgi:hypothetical protein